MCGSIINGCSSACITNSLHFSKEVRRQYIINLFYKYVSDSHWMEASCLGQAELNGTQQTVIQVVPFCFYTWAFFFFKCFLETSINFHQTCWTENVATSLFGSHVELMMRKLNLVCWSLRTIPRLNRADNKATKALVTHAKQVPVFRISELAWLKKPSAKDSHANTSI